MELMTDLSSIINTEFDLFQGKYAVALIIVEALQWVDMKRWCLRNPLYTPFWTSYENEIIRKG